MKDFLILKYSKNKFFVADENFRAEDISPRAEEN